MSAPRLLDLFCGAGGASMGYHRAGFDVVGVDLAEQPRYPFEFERADALDVLDAWNLDDFDAVHASPPCQRYTALKSHPQTRGSITVDLLAPVRDRLVKWGGPFVIENVPGAPMAKHVALCGSGFGLKVWRHRWFEFRAMPAVLAPPCVHYFTPVAVYGHSGGSAARLRGERRWSVDEWREAMGIEWMSSRELAQAIPPAYTEFLAPLLGVDLAVGP